MGSAFSSCLSGSEHQAGVGGLKLLHARLSSSSRERRRNSSEPSDPDEVPSEKKPASLCSSSTVAEIVDTKNLNRIFDTMQNEERYIYACYGPQALRRSESFNEWDF